ncbi:pyridoxal phosphate-dependent aminotransferase [Gloeobacter morelensis]|uniref:Histidinol-phosphate aminotransferase family protein n=1 Tax=Gloeobacter morelensis MG652769 TaxID=2781736 RepID=A0ABY3PNA8_9CYAN|nr:histidinol-phosphate transaminase [Gloeobacter morelensis]UFP95171.1 histidinol-phosphate aminotransferase family protein [Gloeobacter morelensis MG652769]
MEISRRAALQGFGWLAGVSAVAPGRLWAAEVRGVSSVQGVGVPPGTVRLLYNENPLGPSPLALKAASEVLSGCNRYPMATVFALLERICALHGLGLASPAGTADLGALFEAFEASPVLLGAGSSEILQAVALAWGLDGGEFVEASPGYGAVGAAAQEMLGARVRRVAVPLTPEYRHDTQAMAKAVTPKTRVVVVTNPNNPTGTALNLAEITRLADRLDPKMLLVVDEAYIDFTEAPGVMSALGLAASRSNVLVTRTFSKIHGLAGLRLGYAVASAPVRERLRPYLLGMLGINTAVVAAAAASLADADYLIRSRQVALAARGQLLARLPEFGLKPVPSDAPFVWAKVKGDCGPLVQKLARADVQIAGGQRWQLPGYVRISTGLPAEMDMLFATLAAKV